MKDSVIEEIIAETARSAASHGFQTGFSSALECVKEVSQNISDVLLRHMAHIIIQQLESFESSAHVEFVNTLDFHIESDGTRSLVFH